MKFCNFRIASLVLLQGTYCLASSSDCGKSSVVSALHELSSEATYPHQFCQFYMLQDRIRSPFPHIPVGPLKSACTCLVGASPSPLATTSSFGNSPTHQSATTPGSSTSCNTGSVQTVKKAYKSFDDFCSFYVSTSRSQSAIAGMRADQIEKACKCILAADTSISSATSSSSKTSATQSKTSSVHTSTLVKSVKQSTSQSLSKTTSISTTKGVQKVTSTITQSAAKIQSATTVLQSATSIPAQFVLQAVNGSSPVRNGAILGGSGGSGGDLTLDRGDMQQSFSIDLTTGFLYSGGYPVTISYDGYIAPSLTTFSGYPYVAALYGKPGFRLLVCAVDTEMLLRCGVQTNVTEATPYGYRLIDWWCGVGFYGTQIGCFLSANYAENPSGPDPSNDDYSTLDLLVVPT